MIRTNDCAILGIDPGERSGWCLVDRGEVIGSGVARTVHERSAVMEQLDMVREPIVAVVETWTVGRGAGRGGRGDRWNPTTIIGLGSSRGRWLEQLALAGIPQRRIVAVVPRDWRSSMLGPRRWTTEVAKRYAVVVARAKLGRSDVESDEAEAVLIALWGAQATAVAEVLPSRRMPRERVRSAPGSPAPVGNG